MFLGPQNALEQIAFANSNQVIQVYSLLVRSVTN